MPYKYTEWVEDYTPTIEEAIKMLKEHKDGKITLPPNMLKLIEVMVKGE